MVSNGSGIGTGTDSGLSALFLPCPIQEGTDYNGAGFGSIIQSIMIDNITPSWLYIPASDRYVPPLTWGVVFQATAMARTAQALWRTPPGIIPAVTLNLGRASVTFTDQFIPPSSGVSLLTPNQPIHLGKSVTGTSLPVTPPPGANTLALITLGGAAVAWSVLGTSSGAQYVGSGEPATDVLFVPIDLGTDTQYTISGGGVPFSVDATFVVQAVDVVGTVAVAGTVEVTGTVITQTTPAVTLGSVAPSSNKTFVLPVGCQGILLATTGPVLSSAAAGTTTGAQYFDYPGDIASGVGLPAAIFAISQATEGSVIVSNFDPANDIEVIAVFFSPAETTVAAYIAGILPGQTYFTQSGQYYLPVLQRPTFKLATGNVNLVANVGQVMIAAPGVGFSIVLRKLMISAKANATASTLVFVGTASAGAQLGYFSYLLGVAADPGNQDKDFDYEDYLVGDNLPVYITANVALGVVYILTYSIVTTASWLLG